MSSEDIRRIFRVVQKHYTNLVARSKVKQMGVGYTIKDGKLTGTVGIVVFVTKKPTEDQLQTMKIQPLAKTIDNVQTDVIEIPGGFRPRAPDDARHRPFSGGVAMINYRTPGTGTLGLIVKGRTNATYKKLYALTNNHVGANEDVKGLSPPAARRGDPWTQPGAHGGGTVPDDVIARLSKWNRLKPSAPGAVNYYDVAVGKIVKESLADARPYEVMDIGRVRGMADINLGDRVMKRGRTTRKTTGRVVALVVSVTVEYNGFPCDFDDQVIIVGEPESEPFSQPGDSGSVVVSADQAPDASIHRAKALLFAGGKSIDNIDLTVASPIKRIAKDFKLWI